MPPARTGGRTQGESQTNPRPAGILANPRADRSTLVPVESHEDGLAKVEAGEITTYFADQAILIFLMAGSDAPDDLKLGGGQFTLIAYALGMQRGDDDFQLAVDTSLSRLCRSGEVDRIFRNSFGARPPKAKSCALYLISALPE